MKRPPSTSVLDAAAFILAPMAIAKPAAATMSQMRDLEGGCFMTKNYRKLREGFCEANVKVHKGRVAGRFARTMMFFTGRK